MYLSEFSKKNLSTLKTLKIGCSPFCASVLLITKEDHRGVNIVQTLFLLNSCWIETLVFHLFTTKANQNSVRYLISKSCFTNIEVQNVNKAFVYIKNFNPSLSQDFFSRFFHKLFIQNHYRSLWPRYIKKGDSKMNWIVNTVSYLNSKSL